MWPHLVVESENKINMRDDEQLTELHSEVHKSRLPARLLLYLCFLFRSEVVVLSCWHKFRPPLAVPSATCSISLLAAVMLETGIAINRGPTCTLVVSKQDHSVDKHMGASYIGRSRNRFQVDFHG